MTNPPTGLSLVNKDVPSPLMRQTLLDRELVRAVDRPVVRLLPWLNIVAIGGRSIIDRGRETLEPIVDVLRGALADHRMLILTGAGIRGRHVLGVGLDLGLPTGVLAGLVATEAEQNGHLLAALLAKDGVSYLSHTTVAHQLSIHLAGAPAAVSNAFPPYELYELPPEIGKIPPHRSDVGTFLLADAYGAARTIFVKDVDGVMTHDPAGPSADEAELIDRVSVDELRAMDLASLPIDPLVLDLMTRAKHQKEIQIVNGLQPDKIRRALAGEPVGTIIHV